jgi:phospholipase C
MKDYSNFGRDVSNSSYPASYTFIEPSYGHVLTDYKCGTSQHPQDDVTRGEMLIKCTYEAIRSSPLWNSSMLIVTWDEHGGFYDHVLPPGAVAPGDTPTNDPHNQYGFTFQQCGVRVPAIVISPLVPRNLIDRRVYEHSSIPATVEACFGLSPMTNRDAAAHNLMPLVSLSSPRSNAPMTLPAPAGSGVGGCDPFSCSAAPTMASRAPLRPQNPISEDDDLSGILLSVLRWDLTLSPPAQRVTIITRFGALKTRADAWRYMSEVQQKIRTAKIGLHRNA